MKCDFLCIFDQIVNNSSSSTTTSSISPLSHHQSMRHEGYRGQGERSEEPRVRDYLLDYVQTGVITDLFRKRES